MAMRDQVNRPFTRGFFSDGCLHHRTEGQRNWYLDVRLNLRIPHTMLHPKHKVKRDFTTVVSLQLFTSCLNRENSESRFIKSETHHVQTLRRVRSHKRAQK